MASSDRKSHRTNRIAPYLFCAPFFITYCVFTLFSMAFTFVLSFTDWNGFGRIEFIGLKNYARMFNLSADPRFLQTLLNTAVIVVMTVPAGIFLALFLCYFLQKRTVRRKHIFRVLFYLPALMTAVAVGLLWATLFDYESGTVNWLLKALRISAGGINWMGSAWGCRLVLAILIVWSSFGSTMLFFSSALTSVSDDVVDAARMDGAGSVKIYCRICIPMISDVMIFVIITSLINSFQLYDAPVMLFSSGPSGGLPYGGVDRSCLTMVMLIMDEAFSNMHYGYAAALSYGMFLFISFFSFISVRLMTREKAA
ncbi:MAG: sugar ABC transporter permease [Roseburia sp.]|nr:sugar ABC transporter permease [Roseburia sp.]MCM1096676.1 sugar ABC transporter permease [Ruminococcus flavefaciens]